MARAIAIVVCCLFAAALAAAEERVLNIYNWADYIGPRTISDFENEFGIEVNYDVYDSSEVVEAKLLSGNSGYDVVFHAFRYSARLIPIGIYRPLDYSRLPLASHLDPWVLEMMRAYDPGNRHGLPYMWGTTGFAYNADRVRERMPDAPVDSAAMLFDPAVVSKFADCGVSLLDEPTDVIPMVLLYLGLDPNSLEAEDLAAAEAQLEAVRPYIRYFSSTKMLNDLPNEEICVAMSWSGEYALAMQRAEEVGVDVRLAYTVPVEGSMLWFDGIFISSDAPHPDNAHLFLNYLLRPEVIAAISNEVYYANANRASVAYLEPGILNDPAVYPPVDQRSRFSVGVIYEPKLERLRTRSWSRVKTGL
ncbi:MAG: polyamine ABC transporter substrate-binding protein [Xanthomonadales bacterium]|nr:polyamine ABC transporter substrate-binding protein [Xanthomonadales bacterium]